MTVAASTRIALLLVLLLAAPTACGGGTDITREDDEVEDWVAEQRAEAKDRKVATGELPSPHPSEQAQRPAPPEGPGAAMPCSAAWYGQVEARLKVSDAQGHGPNLGSAEWKSAVEHKLGVRDDASFPELGTPAWCERVDQRVLSN